MKKLISILSLSALVFTGCQTAEPVETVSEENESLTVVASFYPLYFFTSEIVGDAENVEVINLIPSGGEPHSYEPSPSQLAQMETADLIVVQGTSLEPWFEALEDELEDGGVETLEVNDDLELMEFEEEHDDHDHDDHGHGEYDPHTWLDPVLAIETVVLIKEELEEVDPVNADTYDANADALISRLEILNESYEESLEACELDMILTSHDAFRYLAERYGLHANAVAGISPFDEPSANQIAELIELSEDEGVQHIFFEVLANSEAAEVLADEAGLSTLVLDPVAGLSEDQTDEDYFSIMEMNLSNLTTGLACE